MHRKLLAFIVTLAWVPALLAQSNGTFVIGAFNVENWNSIERHGKPNIPKPAAEKEAVVQVISSARPDVLGLEEMGNTNDLAELRAALAAKGVDYPHWEHVQAADPDRHVCLLSRFPITARHSRTDYTYPLNGQPTPIGRGILDVLVQVNDRYSFRALVLHLKSKRSSEHGDQAAMRLAEAQLVRNHITGLLQQNPQQNLIAMGDFNDTPETPPIQAVIGTPPFVLFPLPCTTSRGHSGTHYWARSNEWSRIDYLLASPGMSNEFVTGSAHIYEGPLAGKASDHRMVYAGFYDHDVNGVAAPTAGKTRALGLMYLIIVGLLAVVVVLAVLLMYTRRARTEPSK